MSDTLLEVSGLAAGYGRVPVLEGIDLSLGRQELVAVVGANGAGKSTLLRAISGINRAWGGSVRFDGADITRLPSNRRAALGIAHVPENRRVFPQHTVTDNLLLGGYVRRRDREGASTRLEDVLGRFPILRERSGQRAGTLSGGEQQMLAIGMALMADPEVLLLDEPSLGLAPVIVDVVFDHIRALREQGRAILLVEQLATKALAVADRAFVMRLGKVVAAGTGAEISQDSALLRAYLGG